MSLPLPPTQLRLPTLKNQALWQRALTHRSYANENQGILHNERLEFLGDAILCFVVSDYLYHRYPTFREAKLTQLRSHLVDEVQLARFAQDLEIGDLMLLGKGAEKSGERQNPALLSNTLEAIIGAYFIDAGLEPVRVFVQALVSSMLDNPRSPEKQTLKQGLVDVKNRLQQWALGKGGELPQYVLIQENGPAHAKEFTFAVNIQGKPYGEGTGHSKQEATKAAATAALKKLGLL